MKKILITGGARGLQFSSSDNGIGLGAVHKIDAISGSYAKIILATGGTDALTIDSSSVATFAANVISGADPYAGANNGSRLSIGTIYVSRTGGTNTVFEGYTTGTSTPTSKITAAGAATFSGKITTTNTVKCRDVNSDYGGIYFSSGVLLPTQVDGNFATTGLSLGQSGNRFNHLYLTGDVTAAGASFAGDVSPDADATYDLGSATKRWANIYSADLQLSNEGSANDVDGTWGQYTIQEGEDDLFLINRRSGKKYKFNLTEV